MKILEVLGFVIAFVLVLIGLCKIFGFGLVEFIADLFEDLFDFWN